MAKKSRDDHRRVVRIRIRKRVHGTAERPRLSVFRSLMNISAQLIDDARGVTLAAASSVEKSVIGKYSGNVAVAGEVGKLIAARALDRGIRSVVFDRSGYQYHGRIKALADGARQGGLEF